MVYNAKKIGICDFFLFRIKSLPYDTSYLICYLYSYILQTSTTYLDEYSHILHFYEVLRKSKKEYKEVLLGNLF